MRRVWAVISATASSISAYWLAKHNVPMAQYCMLGAILAYLWREE